MGGARPVPDAKPGTTLCLSALTVYLVLAAVIPSFGATTPTTDLSKEDAELVRLRDFLVGPDRTLGTRRDAADLLLENTLPGARATLVEVLSGPAPSEPMLAVLDAVAGRETASEAFIDPLFQLLKCEDEPTRRAAALALGVYQGNDGVRLRLKEMAASAEFALPARLAAVQAMAHLMDKRSIETLVRLACDAKSPVAPAAAEALCDMTGLRENGTSADAWAAWWKGHEQDPEALLLGNLLRHSRDEMKRHDTAADRVQTRLIRHLTDDYEAADAKGKTRMALEQLEDAVPQVRALAARQAAALARDVAAAGNGAARQPYQELIAAVLKHTSDESPMVRAAASEALAAWKETSAGPVLLARLDVEKAPEARAALAAALGSLKIIEAVPRLVALLDSTAEIEVQRAATALGSIGEKGSPGAAAVEAAVQPLGRLARAALPPAVREAACLALSKIAPPSAEGVLAAALEDPIAGVRFSAAQGIGNLGKVSDKTVAALAARLQDENKGMRQAVAAALAKLGGPEAARKMADRLKVGAEAEPAVRNALWAAIKALVDHAGSPDLAQELGDRFFAREGAEEMQHAAALYEAAIAKLTVTARTGPAAQALYEKLVDTYVAAGMPDSAVPALRQLLVITPPAGGTRLRQLNQQLGQVLLAKEPITEAVAPLAAAMKDAGAEDRNAILKAIQTRAEALLKADRPEPAMELLTAFRNAVADAGGTAAADALQKLTGQAVAATVAQAVPKLSGTDEQAAAASATLKKIGAPAVGKLLDALEAAVQEKRVGAEARILAVLEAAGGNKDRGYSLQAPAEERLKKIAAWREST